MMAQLEIGDDDDDDDIPCSEKCMFALLHQTPKRHWSHADHVTGS